MPANVLTFNQISTEMNAIHAQAIGTQPPRAINTGAVITQAQAALLGADMQLVPLTVTENDTYNPPAGKGFGTVTVNVPNPNSVETVTGTLAEPYPDGDWSALKNDILSGNATVNASLRMGDSTGVFSIVPAFGNLNVYGVSSNINVDLESSTAYTINWNNDGSLSRAMVLQNGSVSDLTSLAEYIETTITIIRHPLPEDNT